MPPDRTAFVQAATQFVDASLAAVEAAGVDPDVIALHRAFWLERIEAPGFGPVEMAEAMFPAPEHAHLRAPIVAALSGAPPGLERDTVAGPAAGDREDIEAPTKQLEDQDRTPPVKGGPS